MMQYYEPEILGNVIWHKTSDKGGWARREEVEELERQLKRALSLASGCCPPGVHGRCPHLDITSVVINCKMCREKYIMEESDEDLDKDNENT